MLSMLDGFLFYIGRVLAEFALAVGFLALLLVLAWLSTRKRKGGTDVV